MFVLVDAAMGIQFKSQALNRSLLADPRTDIESMSVAESHINAHLPSLRQDLSGPNLIVAPNQEFMRAHVRSDLVVANGEFAGYVRDDLLATAPADGHHSDGATTIESDDSSDRLGVKWAELCDHRRK